MTGSGAQLPRLLDGVRPSGPPVPLPKHIALHGPLPWPAAPELIGAVEGSGLRGRGGAGFPTATKLAAVAGMGGRAVVVANAAEGEPTSTKDRFLLAAAPHLVLDGAVLAARTVGAGEVILCIHGGAAGAVQAVKAALAERRQADIDHVAVRVVEIPRRYVAGEESALVHFLNGGEPKPTLVPPRPFERGVDGRPTLVQNAETLAHLALIARHGPDWFRAIGTQEAPGSTLVTVAGDVRRAGVLEIAGGAPLDEVIRHAGGDPGSCAAVLLGGYFGTWIGAAEARTIRLDRASLRGAGHDLGAGVIVAIGPTRCGLAETAHAIRYLADQSAGQCGPCVHGLASIANELTGIAFGSRGADPRRLVRWGTQVRGRGACHHPDGAVRLLDSALRVFEDDLIRHVNHGPCATARRPTMLPATPPLATGGQR
jgi:NADH:ubiquinone oxidoreductase subunit F (NADH-binding)